MAALRAFVADEATRPALVARTALLRHGALLLALLVAFVLRERLQVPQIAVWVFAGSGLLNLAIACVSSMRRWVRWGSLLVGLVTWGLLVALTGGARSPLVAGLLLEISSAALIFSAGDLVWITGLVLTTLVAQQWSAARWFRTADSALPVELWVQGCFALLVGVLSGVLLHHYSGAQNLLSKRATTLDQRIATLQREVEETRTFGLIGQNAARQAHQIKSTLAALRGTIQLMDNPTGERAHGRAIEVAHGAVDRLDSLIGDTLRSKRSPTADLRGARLPELQRIVAEVQEQVAAAHPTIRWLAEPSACDAGHAPEIAGNDQLPSEQVSVAPEVFREIVTTLVENAAEAAGNRGEVRVKFEVAGDTAHLVVDDSGPGIALDAEQLFELGVSTKPDGHGVGLCLARRLVEARGGRIVARALDKGGTRFAVALRKQAGGC